MELQGLTTEAAQDLFIAKLDDTAGNISAACRAAGVSRAIAYLWRRDNPEFRRRWEEAQEAATDRLVQEAYRRAFEGSDKDVFYKGEVVGAERQYSDTLAIFLLKCHRRATYGDQTRITHSFDLSKLTNDELEQLEPTLMKLLGPAG